MIIEAQNPYEYNDSKSYDQNFYEWLYEVNRERRKEADYGFKEEEMLEQEGRQTFRKMFGYKRLEQIKTDALNNSVFS
jgi:hypothetical protein|tara:strand:+ start:6519 stop:6752 length:234 start_codon:yes stop_codon:yes gene_type:complete